MCTKCKMYATYACMHLCLFGFYISLYSSQLNSKITEFFTGFLFHFLIKDSETTIAILEEFPVTTSRLDRTRKVHRLFKLWKWINQYTIYCFIHSRNLNNQINTKVNDGGAYTAIEALQVAGRMLIVLQWVYAIA